MSKRRYTIHDGEWVDISDDKRPTAFDSPPDIPIRVVKCWHRELLIYIGKLLVGYSATMRLSGEHAKYHKAAMEIEAIIYEVVSGDDSNLD